MTTMAAGRVAAGMLGAMLLAMSAEAQVWIGTAGPRAGSVEVSAGGAFNMGRTFETEDAGLTPNPSGGQTSFTLFRTESELRSAPGAHLALGVYLTRTLAVEAGFRYARPELQVRLTGDFENAPDVTATTAISEYLFTGSLLYHFGLPGSRRVPFIAGGAGHLRDVHVGNGLVETGTEYHARGGMKFWFGRRQKSGLRLEGGVSIRDGGFTFDEDRRIVPNASASFAYRF